MAYERLKKRGRKEEAGVPMEFIQVFLVIKDVHLCPVKAVICYRNIFFAALAPVLRGVAHLRKVWCAASPRPHS